MNEILGTLKPKLNEGMVFDKFGECEYFFQVTNEPSYLHIITVGKYTIHIDEWLDGSDDIIGVVLVNDTNISNGFVNKRMSKLLDIIYRFINK